jgi:hypothetical protein
MNARYNAAIQEVTIQFISYNGELTSLAKFVAATLGEQAPSMDELTHYMRKAETHAELLKYGVGLWKNTNGSWSLVSLATPPTIEGMRYRLEHFPTSNTQCRWCLQDAKRLADLDLVVEKDIRNEPVHNSRLHRVCMKPWLTMRNQVTRADAAPAKRESLI